jgi:hypothetical protein
MAMTALKEPFMTEAKLRQEQTQLNGRDKEGTPVVKSSVVAILPPLKEIETMTPPSIIQTKTVEILAKKSLFT